MTAAHLKWRGYMGDMGNDPARESATGGIEKLDDLPKPQRINVDVRSAPLNKRRGDTPAWTDAEIDDVIAFLTTLNDGYTATVARRYRQPIFTSMSSV